LSPVVDSSHNSLKVKIQKIINNDSFQAEKIIKRLALEKKIKNIMPRSFYRYKKELEKFEKEHQVLLKSFVLKEKRIAFIMELITYFK
jgi:hypothetical protein